VNPIKRLFSMVFKRDSFRFYSAGRHLFNFAREVGDPMSSSAVAACVRWFARNFPEAPPAIWRKLGNGQEEQEDDLPLLRLLQRPNAHYTGSQLWMATTTDWNVDGNGYWIAIPNRAGTPVELWWTPSWQITPKGNPGSSASFIDYYEYLVDGEPIKLDPKYVIHFRNGLDPENPRLGYSPLRSVLREVFTDNEAATFTASLLRNMGVPGLMVSPESGLSINLAEAEETKDDLIERFTGDRRGEPLVMTTPTKIEQFGFAPDQLLLRDLRQIPEERISAVTGVPAVVAGLGAGLARSTFTNMAEAREAAYESGLIPAQKILGEDIRFQLLPLFGEDPFKFRFGFDLSKVRVLQEDLFRQAQRHDLGVQGGWETVLEARRAMGLEVDEARDNMFLRDWRKTMVDAKTGVITPLKQAPATDPSIPDVPGAENGNGHVDADEVADRVLQGLDRRELSAK
jgi:HK97 family phage portal protein